MNHRCLLKLIGYILSAEKNAHYFSQQHEPAIAA